jgi:hypothetical protein
VRARLAQFDEFLRHAEEAAVASSTLQAETTALRERVAELEALLADALALQVRVCAVRLQPTWAVRGAQCSSSCPCLVLAAGLTPPVSWARFCCSVDSIKSSNMLTAAPPPLPVLQDENAGAANAAAATALAYQPPSSGMGWLGDAGSAAFGGAMVLSFATGLMGAGGGVGMGALGMAGFAQTFYYSGNLPITNMPEVSGWRARALQCSSPGWRL